MACEGVKSSAANIVCDGHQNAGANLLVASNHDMPRRGASVSNTAVLGERPRRAGAAKKGLWSFVFTVLLGLPMAGCAGEEASSGCESKKDCSSDEACISKPCVALSEADASSGDQGEADDDTSGPSLVTPNDADMDDDSDDDSDDDTANDDSDDDTADDDSDLSDDDVPDDDDAADDDAADDDSAGDDDTVVVVVPRPDDDVACDEACDDGVECTVDACDNGQCTHDQAACECLVDEDCLDENACTSEACVDGECVATVLVGEACDDGVECSASDLCQEDGSCVGSLSGCVPAEWTCASDRYGDGTCDCGCGAHDADCASALSSECEMCGGCAVSCARIDPVDNSACVSVPPGWSCSGVFFGDGRCDCGCGAFDVDCANVTLAACTFCTANGSCADSCADILPNDNTACLEVGPPAQWACDPAWYGDGDCDCGCGAVDADCPNTLSSSCEFCALTGSCADGRTCAGIAPDDNATCIPIPAEWDCSDEFFGDGQCDCGCGASDVDCVDGLSVTCDYCSCEGALDDCSVVAPFDNASCSGTWTCDPLSFGDGTNCDCGCGNFDPDCASTLPGACDVCDAAGSCSDVACAGLRVDANAICGPPPGWTCPVSEWGEGDCDCGCGMPDIDCVDGTAVSCDSCGATGSCAASDCALINPNDNAACLDWTCQEAWLSDGDCDCGCGALDPACEDAGVDACLFCWCGGTECDRVNTTQNWQCELGVEWNCDPSYYEDGIDCDCGCGSVDPDCADALATSCDYCEPGSCADITCQGLDPNDNAVCTGL